MCVCERESVCVRERERDLEEEEAEAVQFSMHPVSLHSKPQPLGATPLASYLLLSNLIPKP